MKRIIPRLILAAGFLLLSAPSARAGGAGTTGAPFLKVPTNARAAALAGSFTSISGDGAAIEYNPAGIAGLKRTDIDATYLKYFEGTSFQAVGFSFPFSFSGASDDVLDDQSFVRGRWAAGLRYRGFSADDTTRNDVGVEQGGFTIRDQAIHAAVASPIGTNFAVGGGLKWIREQIDADSVTNFAGDVGVIWKAPAGFSVGASVLNLGASSKAFEQESDPLPTQLRLGASHAAGPVLIALDAAEGRDSVTKISAGGEWAPVSFVRLRAGAFHQTTLGFTGGLGLQFAGPEKTPTNVVHTPRGRRQSDIEFNDRKASELLDRLKNLALDLTDRFETSRRRASDYTIAVLPPSGTSDRMGSALADLLGQQFSAEGAFQVAERSKVDEAVKDLGYRGAFLDDAQAARVGRRTGASAVVVSQMMKGPSSYSLQSRIILVEEESAAAAAAATLPLEYFIEKLRLESAPAVKNESARSSESRMEIGIDYAVTTSEDLGLTHTVSLRLLY